MIQSAVCARARRPRTYFCATCHLLECMWYRPILPQHQYICDYFGWIDKLDIWIEEPWGTPNSCYPFTKKIKKIKTTPTFQNRYVTVFQIYIYICPKKHSNKFKKTKDSKQIFRINGKYLFVMKWNYLELKRMKRNVPGMFQECPSKECPSP